ncbi:unnamed protein product [Merluccius merluccius]
MGRHFGQCLFVDKSKEQLVRKGRAWFHVQRGYSSAQLRHLRQHVCLAAPWSLNEALQEAERAEAIFHIWATPPRAPSSSPHITGHHQPLPSL